MLRAVLLTRTHLFCPVFNLFSSSFTRFFATRLFLLSSTCVYGTFFFDFFLSSSHTFSSCCFSRGLVNGHLRNWLSTHRCRCCAALVKLSLPAFSAPLHLSWVECRLVAIRWLPSICTRTHTHTCTSADILHAWMHHCTCLQATRQLEWLTHSLLLCARALREMSLLQICAFIFIGCFLCPPFAILLHLCAGQSG